MYSEVLHDNAGNIKACYCADTLPVETNAPMFRFSGVPDGLTHARLNIDTLTAMEIEAGCGTRAELDGSGNPVLVNVDRTRYIMENFAVDLEAGLAHEGLVLRGIRRKG
ncbi:MAG: hypothetical protein HS130_12510 [Deltaproteobacteria bacterium]|nr:hypothetical protein [Deltaproteobacteria bacterium]MCL4874676.1 hypothetical protein [bacterium]